MARLLGIITLQITCAILSPSTADAFVPPPCQSRRAAHQLREISSIEAGATFIPLKRRLLQEYHAHVKEDDCQSVTYRPATVHDIARCHEIEAASYPEDEAASLENLQYRQQSAGDYFWCATLPDEEGDRVIGFICSTRCNEFTEESMSTHDPSGSILAVHSVVVDSPYRRQGIASDMMGNYLQQMIRHSSLVADTGNEGFQRILLLAKSHLLSFYVDNGFAVLRPSPIVHGKETWYELQGREEYLERMLRMQPGIGATEDVPNTQIMHASNSRKFESSRSTANPDEGQDGNVLIEGRELRRQKIHIELQQLGIDPEELEAHPERFGTAAMRTYNSFLLPKSAGALAVAESPTRPRVVANNISFLVREFNAAQEQWLRNVDRNRGNSASDQISGDEASEKHPITIVLDNIRSAHNVGNILRLAEAAQVDSVRLCGMTPRPPHPKVMKTAMGAAEYVSTGDDEDSSTSTLKTVLDLKSKGYKVFGVETTENAVSLFDTPMPDRDAEQIAFVFGNELIGVDVEVLRECDGIICLPTYGMKNSLNVATCVGIVVWDRLRRLKVSHT